MKNKKILFILVLIIIMSSSIIVAFNSMDMNKGVKITANSTQQQSNLLKFSLNNMDIDIDFNQRDTWYDMPMMTSEFDMILKVPDNNKYKYEINSNEVKPGSSVSIKLNELSKTSGIAINIIEKGSDDIHKYAIRSLNSKIPDFDANYSDPEDGFYYFNCEDFIYKMNTKGEIVFYKYTPGHAIDFKRTEVKGTTYYTYLENIQDISNNEIIKSYDPSNLVVMDENYNVIDQISKTISDQENNRVSQYLDWHDVIVLDKGNYIIMSYGKEQVKNIPDNLNSVKQGTKVLSGIVQEIKDGKLIFEWRSTDYPELYSYSKLGNDYMNRDSYYADYLHLNSIQIDPKDGNIILSLRNLDSIVKINRETGDIIWTLGGKGDEFNLNDNERMNKQHYARYTEKGTITVFDNGFLNTANFNDKYQSSVKEYKIDEENKQLLEFNEYKVDGRYSPIMGSAERLDTDSNRFIIGWGGRSSCTPLFSEENFDTNETIFELNYYKNFSDDVFLSNSYRAYKDTK